jgi:hypothetical protein
VYYDDGAAWHGPYALTGNVHSIPPGGSVGQVLTKNTAIDYDVIWGVGGGGGGATTYTFTQGTPAATWNVAHSLGRFPSVTVVDTGGTVVIPNVTYVDANNVTVVFGSATTGKAYLN